MSNKWMSEFWVLAYDIKSTRWHICALSTKTLTQAEQGEISSIQCFIPDSEICAVTYIGP